MKSDNEIFIDASFFCAFYNENDALFKKASSYIELLNTKKIFTSNFILLESYTVISQRVSKKAAIEFGKTIQNMPEIKIIKVDQDLEKSSWEIFEIIADKNMSYVDCSTITLMQENSIRQLLTFDSHFKKHTKQFGYKIV